MEKSWNMIISQKVMESSWMLWKSHGIACYHGYGSFLVCDCRACCETQSYSCLKACENGSHGKKQISHGKVTEFCFLIFVGTLNVLCL